MQTAQETTRHTARDIAMAYHRAWSTGDFERAMTFIDDGIICQAPSGVIEGADAFRAFMGPFAEMVEEVHLRAAFGDEHTAVTMYDTRTGLVPDAPGAELATVSDGKIVQMRIIFDQLPWEATPA